MGQKVNPKIFRMGITQNWGSIWYADKNYAQFLEEDIKMRKFILKEFKSSLVEKVIIERSSATLTINVFAVKPGIIIGRSGAGIEEFKKKLVKKFNLEKKALNINIKEVERPFLSSCIVMQGVIADLEKRIPFRRAVKQAISKVERAGALGVKIIVSGRLNGVDIARRETFASGKIPLHTMRADIDYCRGIAQTTYGTIGVKVWIYKGEVFNKSKKG